MGTLWCPPLISRSTMAAVVEAFEAVTTAAVTLGAGLSAPK